MPCITGKRILAVALAATPANGMNEQQQQEYESPTVSKQDDGPNYDVRDSYESPSPNESIEGEELLFSPDGLSILSPEKEAIQTNVGRSGHTNVKFFSLGLDQIEESKGEDSGEDSRLRVDNVHKGHEKMTFDSVQMQGVDISSDDVDTIQSEYRKKETQELDRMRAEADEVAKKLEKAHCRKAVYKKQLTDAEERQKLSKMGYEVLQPEQENPLSEFHMNDVHNIKESIVQKSQTVKTLLKNISTTKVNITNLLTYRAYLNQSIQATEDRIKKGLSQEQVASKYRQMRRKEIVGKMDKTQTLEGKFAQATEENPSAGFTAPMTVGNFTANSLPTTLEELRYEEIEPVEQPSPIQTTLEELRYEEIEPVEQPSPIQAEKQQHVQQTEVLQFKKNATLSLGGSTITKPLAQKNTLTDSSNPKNGRQIRASLRMWFPNQFRKLLR